MKKVLPLFAFLAAAIPAALAYDAGDDAGVPAAMIAGGTALDPAQYTIGVAPNYFRDLSGTVVFVGATGTTNIYNFLTIQNGATLLNTTGYVGFDTATPGGNSVKVTGTTALGGHSTWTNTSFLAVGYSDSTNNTLTIEAGGRVTSDYGIIGYGPASTGNVVKVTGTASSWTNSNALTIGQYGSNNTLTIEAGGKVSSTTGIIGAGLSGNPTFGSGNSAKVTGANSQWTLSSNLSVGQVGSNNTLTIENRGLVSLTNPAATVGFNTGGGLQLKDGIFAWAGDHTSAITTFVNNGKVLYWSGSGYTVATTADLTNGHVTLAYYPDGASATAATGGLYTFLIATTILTAIPEPSTYGIALAALLGVVILRRRRRLA